MLASIGLFVFIQESDFRRVTCFIKDLPKEHDCSDNLFSVKDLRLVIDVIGVPKITKLLVIGIHLSD